MSDYVADASPPVPPSKRSTINGPADVATLCAAMTRYRQEHVRVLILNTRNELLRKSTVCRGTLNAAMVHPREVFYPAIKANAAAIVLVHNHPSGDPEPSRDDCDLTTRIRKAGDLLGITLLDHIVIAKRGWVSLRERGVL